MIPCCHSEGKVKVNPSLSSLEPWPHIVYHAFIKISHRNTHTHSDSCPSNICPGDIFPYQEYLSCYCPDFDETLKAAS